MSIDDIPVLEPDCDVELVPDQQAVSEPGNLTFTRDLARHISDLLHLPVVSMRTRSNPFYRRSCPRVSTYEVTVGGHDIAVTAYESTYPLIRGPVPAYAVVVDGQRVPFERSTFHESLAWQLARAVWIAVTDREIAAQRAARETAESTSSGAEGSR